VVVGAAAQLRDRPPGVMQPAILVPEGRGPPFVVAAQSGFATHR
jgi:hypothetical protein